MLKGSLEEFALPDIFRLLSLTKRTGKLDVQRAAGSGTVYFKAGDVYFAECSLTREPLGQKLIRAGVLTERALMAALDEHAETGRRVGEILVARGEINQEQLEAAIQGQVQDAAFELLAWDKGDFEFEGAEEVVAEIPISVPVDDLIEEAARRLDELQSLGRKIPSVASVLQVAETPPEGAHEINITPEEWRLLVLVDGRRSIRDIAAAAHVEEFEAMKVLHGLVEAGLVEVVPDKPATTIVVGAASAAPAPQADPAPAPAPERGPARRPEIVPEPEPGPVAPVRVERDELVLEDPLDDDPRVEPTAVEPKTMPIYPPPQAARPAPDPVVRLEPVAQPVPESVVQPEPEPVAQPAPQPVVPSTPSAPEADEVAETYLGSFLGDEPEAPQPPPAQNGPAAPAAAPGPAPKVDRAAVVRELASLFSDEEPSARRPSRPSPPASPAAESRPNERPPAEGPKRVEDDDQLNRGIINRLIDGVKGI